MSGPIAPPSIRVVVVDDQELVRRGFVAIISTDPTLEIVGIAAHGLEAVTVCRSVAADVVVMDIRMPVMDGIEATRHIVAGSHGAPRVLVLTTFDLDELVLEALHAGASGFLLKDCRPDDLLRAIHTLADGEAALAPSVTRRLLATVATQTQTELQRRARIAVDGLTERERDVLRLVARGASNQEIADRMYVAETTVKTHVGRILAKLGARDRVNATVMAFDAGLVAPGSG